MYQLILPVKSILFGAVRNLKSSLPVVMFLLVSSFAVTAQANVVYDFEGFTENLNDDGAHDGSYALPDSDYPAYGYAGRGLVSVVQEDGVSSSAMLRFENGVNAEWWSGFTLAIESSEFDLIGDGSAPVTMKVLAGQDGDIRMDLEADGQTVYVVNLPVVAGWNDLSFDVSGADTSVNWHKIQIRPDAAGQVGNDDSVNFYYFDDITFPNATLVAAPGEPTTAAFLSGAPTPTPAEAVSLFSDSYTSALNGVGNTSWSQGTASELAIDNGNTIKKFDQTVFVGFDVPSDVSIGGISTLNISLYRQASSEFEIKLVDLTEGTGGEMFYYVPAIDMTPDQWSVVEIPLADFTGLVGNVDQIVLKPMGGAETFYMDDMYFHGGDNGGDTDTGGELLVIFSVDMTGIDLQGQVPTLNGIFNDWCGDCAPMYDDDGDNIWSLELPISDFFDNTYANQYLFSLGNWVSQEIVPPLCAFSPNSEYVNRSFTLDDQLTEDLVLPTTPWGGCPVSDEIFPYLIFSVDMTGVDLQGQVPTLNATFNGWCGDCMPMSNEDGDNIWTLEIPIIQIESGSSSMWVDGQFEYKYALGDWVDQESVPSRCGFSSEYDDYVNRTFNIKGNTDLGVDVWSGCIDDPLYSLDDGFFFADAFGGALVSEESVFNFPSSADSWAGFANLNASLYPIKLTEAGSITFNASVPSGGDVDVRFRFEKNPHPDTEPSFNTDVVTVSGAETASYTINVPAQGANTFASFIMYLDTNDVPIVITDVVANADADADADADAGAGGVAPEPGAMIALPVDFEEAPADYQIAGFDGGVATLGTGPDGANSLKYVKGAGQNWAGVWINLDTVVDAANGEIITADVHSTVARDITLKFDAANVERGVSHGGTGWESLSYDFTGAMPAGQTKIVFFNDLSQQGDGSADWTIYIDNLVQSTGGYDSEYTPADGFRFTEAFGGTQIESDDSFLHGTQYVRPASAEFWSGFANMNTSLYPLTFAEDHVITFEAGVLDGSSADVRFRFENNPPDFDPSFNTASVTVSGAEQVSYSIDVPAQGGNTFSQFLMYIDTVNVVVGIGNITISVAPVDSDNDGVNDDEDAFPNDASETADSDNDGVGDNGDAFPNDSSETADSDNDGVGDNADYAPNDSAVQEGPKQSVFVSGSPKGMVGSPVSVTVGYDVSDADSSLTGLGLRVHYDSSVLTFVEFADVLSTDNISSGQPANDTDNEDGDASTDKYITANWASLFGNWPGSLPADLLTATFNVADDDSLVNTVINFSAASNAAGYQFDATPYTLDIVSGSFDFDGNGTADALTDGLMMIRFAFGLTGDAVTIGAIADDSIMTSEEVLAALETASVSFADIDGNGVFDALTDGLMLVRYLFDSRGDSLISLLGGGATRTTAANIEGYMDDRSPTSNNDEIAEQYEYNQSVFVSSYDNYNGHQVTVAYNASQPYTTGLGLRIHYDSSHMEFGGISVLTSQDNMGADGPYDDVYNFDGDASTDKYVIAYWASLIGYSWPGVTEADLVRVSFSANNNVFQRTQINFTSSSNAAGFGFFSTSFGEKISWDFDGNGTVDALTDGLLFLRYAFNLRGSLLVRDGVVASDSPLTNAEIQSNLEAASVSFADFDGNGSIGALSDGLLLLRYLFGLRGEMLVDDVIATDATRSSAEDISQHIELYMP